MEAAAGDTAPDDGLSLVVPRSVPWQSSVGTSPPCSDGGLPNTNLLTRMELLTLATDITSLTLSLYKRTASLYGGSSRR